MRKTIDRFALVALATPARRRAAAWAAKFGALFMAFFVFFIPVSRDLGVSTSMVVSLKNEIKSLKDISINLMTPEELKAAEERVVDFRGRLMDYTQTGALLDFITQQAEENHFHIVQVYSDSPVVIKDGTGKDLELDGKKLMWIPVSFRVETDFKSMGNFLKSLKDKAKGNFVIESMALSKPSSDSEVLQCDLTLSFIGK
jgi:hypothetical protein